jgi:UDP-N-acetylglucosamine:LPS N-acetylglucosamine transferase
LPQGELNLQNLTNILKKFIDNPSSLAAMAEAALAQALPDAAKKLAIVCLEVCHGR